MCVMPPEVISSQHTPQSADSLAASSLSASGRGSLTLAARSAGSYKSQVHLSYLHLVVFVGF